MVLLGCVDVMVLLLLCVVNGDFLLIMFDEYYIEDYCYCYQEYQQYGQQIQIILMGGFEGLCYCVGQVGYDGSEDQYGNIIVDVVFGDLFVQLYQEYCFGYQCGYGYEVEVGYLYGGGCFW